MGEAVFEVIVQIVLETLFMLIGEGLAAVRRRVSRRVRPV